MINTMGGKKDQREGGWGFWEGDSRKFYTGWAVWASLRRKHWSKNSKKRKELAMQRSGRCPGSIHSQGMDRRQEHAQPLEGMRSSWIGWQGDKRKFSVSTSALHHLLHCPFSFLPAPSTSSCQLDSFQQFKTTILNMLIFIPLPYTPF